MKAEFRPRSPANLILKLAVIFGFKDRRTSTPRSVEAPPMDPPPVVVVAIDVVPPVDAARVAPFPPPQAEPRRSRGKAKARLPSTGAGRDEGVRVAL
jgi:hypothetical protein